MRSQPRLACLIGILVVALFAPPGCGDDASTDAKGGSGNGGTSGTGGTGGTGTGATSGTGGADDDAGVDATAGSAGDASVDADTSDAPTDAPEPYHYGLEIFVATDGDDTQAGTEAAPFATLERAQEELRAVKTGGGLPDDGVVIWLREGVYERAETFTMSSEDSGEATKPVVIRGYPGEVARLVGGKQLPASGFVPVTSSDAIWSRLDDSARDHIVVADLAAQGIDDYGTLAVRGFGKTHVAALELFFNGQPMTLARWPDAGVSEGIVSSSNDTVSLYGNPSPDVTGDYSKNGQQDGVNAFMRAGLVGGLQYHLYRHTWDYQGATYTAWFLTTGTSGYPGGADPWWSRYDAELGSMNPSNGASGNPTAQNPNALNHGFAQIAEAISDTSFRYAGDRAQRWTGATDLWMHGFWKHAWADLHVPVASIDTSSRVVTFDDTPGYGIEAWQPYYAENLVEEITVPGEWYLDRDNGLLYMWPPAALSNGEVVASMMEAALVRLEGTSYVQVEDLTIEAGRERLVVIEGGEHNRVRHCVLRNAGTTAASVSGSDNGIERTSIVDPGDSGASLTGGDRASLTEAGNFVRNCDIQKFGRWSWTYKPGVSLSGAGHVVAHNLMHDAPHSAILYGGNEHLIELNEIHGVCQFSSDAGAIYSGRDWGYRGNLIQHNFIHHIDTWFEGYGVHGVYLDDCLSGIEVKGNVFYEVSGHAILHGGGRDDIMHNNIMAKCGTGLSADSRGITAINNTPGDSWNMLERLAKDGIQYQQDPWATAYPKLAVVPNDWAQLSDPNALWLYPEGCVFDRNLGWSNTNWTREGNYGGTGTLDKYESIADNVEDADPKFVDEASLNLALQPDSPAYDIPGFETIPFADIGIEP